jgi:hypothetical protein
LDPAPPQTVRGAPIGGHQLRLLRHRLDDAMHQPAEGGELPSHNA